MSDERKFDWDSGSSAYLDILREMRIEDGEETERTNPLPFPIYRIERPKSESKWRKYNDRTLFRFQGDFRTDSQTSSTGYEFYELVRTPFWKSQLILSIWSDLGSVPTNDLPGYLRHVPVGGWSPLSKALGLTQGGQLGEYSLPRKDAKGTMKFKHHRTLGMKPEEVYWASAIVTTFHDKEPGPGVEAVEFQAVVMMKPWHFRKFAEALDNFRQTKGRRWSIAGVPFTLHDVQPPRGVPPTTTQMKIRLEEENHEVYGPEKFRDFSFDEVALTIHSHLEDWLNQHAAPIKDYPSEGDYPDGWASTQSLYEEQYQAYLHNKATGFEDNDPPFEEDRWSGKSNEDLEILMVEYGIPVPKRGKTRDKMISLIEKAQERL